MTDFSLPSGRARAHQHLPRWLCVYLACGYADSVVDGPECEAAVARGRLWLRDQATEDECYQAAIRAYDAADRPMPVEAASASAAFYAASCPKSIEPWNAAGHAASCAAHLLDAGPSSLESYYDEVLALLNGFDWESSSVEQPVLDWLDERAPMVRGEWRRS